MMTQYKYGMTNLSKTTLAPFKMAKAEQDTYATSGWKTIIFNCYCHTLFEAAEAIGSATHCSVAESIRLAGVAETTGQAIVLEGSEFDCETAAEILRNSGLTALATP